MWPPSFRVGGPEEVPRSTMNPPTFRARVSFLRRPVSSACRRRRSSSSPALCRQAYSQNSSRSTSTSDCRRLSLPR